MKKLIAVMLVCFLALTGCSSKMSADKAEVKWNNGEVSVNGKAMQVDSYYGYGAFKEDATVSASFTYTLITSEDLSTAEGNSAGIAEVDMDAYKDGAKAFTRYLGTYAVMYYPLGDSKYIMGNVSCNESSTEQLYLWLYNDIKSLTLTDGSVEVNFEDMFILKDGGSTLKVSNNGASVTGTIKVTKETKAECTSPFTIIQGEQTFSAPTYSTNKFAYYQYGEFLIQTIVGLNLSDYITFK